jgi:hypothetical protein
MQLAQNRVHCQYVISIKVMKLRVRETAGDCLIVSDWQVLAPWN